MKKLFLYLKLLSAITLFIFAATACSQNDDEPNGSSPSISVTINTDGSTSNGAVFIPVSDDSFYLDYVLYKIVEAHLEVVGVDKSEIKGNVTIYSPVTYQGAIYKTRKIDEKALESVNTITSIKLANDIEEIDESAFWSCKNLQSIDLPYNLNKIGVYAFSHCTSLKEIILPENVTHLPSHAFSDCKALEKVKISPKLTSIGRSCFNDCISLEDIDLSKGIEYIDHYAFSRCKHLRNIIISTSCEFIFSYAFYDCNINSIQLPGSLKYTYKEGSYSEDTNNAFYNSKIENVEAHLSHWSELEIKRFFEGADITHLKIY